MRIKTPAIKAQETILYNELIKYVELVASTRHTERPEDFLDYAAKRPAFLLVASSLSVGNDLIISSHNISPASLRQDTLEPIEMPVIAGYGRTSIATALMISRMRAISTEVIDIAEEVGEMRGGVGRA